MKLPNTDFLRSLAEKVSEIQLHYFENLRPEDVDTKRRRDFLTVADSETEALIIREIQSHFPHHSILAEESGSHIQDSPYTWIIDPVDGTTNFARGFPMFSASIALCEGLTPILGLVVAPYLREVFIAEKGQGAFLNDRRLRVSTTPDVASAILATGFAYVRNEVQNNNIADFSRLILECHDIRRAGAASVDLAYVACGRFDAYWEPYLKPWDVAAGALLVTEAGGQITDYAQGDEWLFGENLVASNGRIHAELASGLTPLDENYETWGRDIQARIRENRS